MDEIKDVSKAVAEISKLGTKTFDSGDKFGRFLSNVFGGSAKAGVGMVEDKLEFWRWERKIRLVDRVNEYCIEKDLTRVMPILPKFAIPMIENASLEEDDDLQDIWCRLIVNNLDPNFDFEMRYAFIEIIKSLTALDAQILKAIYDKTLIRSPLGKGMILGLTKEFWHMNFFDKRQMTNFYTSNKEIQTEINCTDEVFYVSLHNLLRVQCLKDSSLAETIDAIQSAGDSECLEGFVDLPGNIISGDHVALTPLGIKFIEACLK